MIVKKREKQGAGMSFDFAEVEFSPNEPGIPFGDNLALQVSCICHQFGDNPTPVLPPIRLLPVTNLDNLEPADIAPHIFEVVDLSGDLIEMELI